MPFFPARPVRPAFAAGVVGAVEISRRLQGDSLLLLDIGGGSLEIAAGQDEYPQAAVSVPLGAGRTYADFIPDPIPTPEDIHRLRKHARAQIGRIAGKINRVGAPDHVVGSSKTFRSLARIAGAAPSGDGIYVPRKLFRRDLPGIIDHIVWCVHNGYIPEARVDEAAARVQQQFIDTDV